MLKIQQTTDYSQFKFLKDGQRDPTPQFMIQSIQQKNLLAEHPIICDVDMNVIDGQNRLKAAEFLKLPIYYIVSENITAADIGICQVQKPWSMADFLRFYKKNDDYAFVEEMMVLYILPIHFVIYCCNQASNINKDFRAGNFVVKKDKQFIRERLGYVKAIVNEFSHIKKNSGEKDITISSRMHRALWTFVCREDYQHSRMMHQIQTFPSNVIPILSFNSDSMIFNSLKKRIYNFKKESQNRVD